MKITSLMLIALATSVSSVALAQPAQAPSQDNVLTYHGTPNRSGHYEVPGLTWGRAKSVHLDEAFQAHITGNVYAQPLYWRSQGSSSGRLLVATEDNNVYALDAITGAQIWRRSLGRPVPRSALRCGNINPLGVTGTPVIDEATAAVYLDAAIAETSGPRHRIFALSLKDGTPLPGWPIDVADALRTTLPAFNTRDQNQRGALTILDGILYVPFGGHFGDCGDYRGWVVGVSLQEPRKVISWSTRARGGGIWAPGGISAVGHSLFVATGNTFGASNWSDGEGVFRLAPDLHRSSDKRDFFAPPDWRALDERDLDLGGTAPLPFSVGNQALILALGKDGRAYLLDQNNLGGVGGSLVAQTVSQRALRTAPAVYSMNRATYVAFQGPGVSCPAPQSEHQLTVLKIGVGERPSIAPAWCGNVIGAGSPIVTTTDSGSDPIVWMVGAEGDNRLHGFKGDTGAPLVTSPTLAGLRHFQTLIATKDRLFVGADGRVYAFAF
jgi:outer membrane protein assembly factor BamB